MRKPSQVGAEKNPLQLQVISSIPDWTLRDVIRHKNVEERVAVKRVDKISSFILIKRNKKEEWGGR